MAGELYRFEMNGLFRSSLALLDEDGQFLVANDFDPLLFAPEMDGTFYIAASSPDLGEYEISFSTIEDIDGSTDTEAEIGVGETLDGSLEFGGDTDWFRVELTAGQSYLFCMEAPADSNGDPVLRLLDADGFEIDMNDDFDGSLNAQILYTAEQDQVVYLEASDFFSDTVGYTITVKDVPAPSSEIIGTEGRDNLMGTEGDDIMRSLGGKLDRMDGKGGADTFVFGLSEADNGVRERDIIRNFELGVDMIALEEGVEVSSVRDISTGLVVTLNNDRDTIYVTGDGVSSSDLEQMIREVPPVDDVSEDFASSIGGFEARMSSVRDLVTDWFG
jgi:hypothetical protein